MAPASLLSSLNRLLVSLALCATLASPFALHSLPRPSSVERPRHHTVRNTPHVAPLQSTLVPGPTSADDDAVVVRAYTVEQQLREVDARIAETLVPGPTSADDDAVVVRSAYTVEQQLREVDARIAETLVVRAYTVEQQLREVDARIAEVLRAKRDVERDLEALDRRRKSLRSFSTRVKEAVQVPTRSFVRWIKGERDNTLAAAGQA